MKVVIIGGGIAGLVSAYVLSRNSEATIILFEKADKLGGLAASIDLGKGYLIEKYYHFICKMDNTYIHMMRELNIDSLLRWKTTEMGFYYNGSVYTLSDPLSLLRCKYLSTADKIRFAKTTLKTKLTTHKRWTEIANKSARAWLLDQYGERAYKLLFDRLLDLKFREYADCISSAWMWARHYRLATSRTFTQKERVGYLVGGSQAYIDRLQENLLRRGVVIRVGTGVDELVMQGGLIRGVRAGKDSVTCDHLISTIPLPFLRPLIESFEGAYWNNIRSLESIGVVVVILRLKRKFSRYFWININDLHIELAGIIEYTNLNPCEFLGGDAIVYLPHYASGDHPIFAASDEDLLARSCYCLGRINPDFDQSWVKQYWVRRDRYAQPICDVGFADRTPAMQTPVENMYFTDSHQLHPHDRAISASSDLGERVAHLVLKKMH
jgi:protoporphyrinogen oxidase